MFVVPLVSSATMHQLLGASDIATALVVTGTPLMSKTFSKTVAYVALIVRFRPPRVPGVRVGAGWREYSPASRRRYRR